MKALRSKLGEMDVAIAYGAVLAVVGAVIAFCGWGLAASFWRGGFGTEAAAWAQAGGSIAAIAGAVWISRAEERRTRRLRRHEREEVAWGVRFAISAARNEAYTIAHELADPATALASENGRHWRTRARNARYLLQSYASRTDHLHPVFVQAANNALLLVEEMEADIGRAAALMSSDGIVPMKVASDLAWYESHFSALLNLVDERVPLIEAALDRGEDMLPLHEFRSGRNSKGPPAAAPSTRP